MAELTDPDIRETVRERYAAAARAAAQGQGCDCGTEAETTCCGTEVALADEHGTQVFGDALYTSADTGGATDGAIAASLGCGELGGGGTRRLLRSV